MPDGEIITAHCPNPGSMLGISEPGLKVLMAKSANPQRKLPWTMQFVETESSLVLIESALANKLFFEAFQAGLFDSLKEFVHARPEHTYKDSRFDFLLSRQILAPKDKLDLSSVRDRSHCLVEVKSTTYLDQGVALFPDAKTERGRKHLRTLSEGLDEGFAAVQFYVVARSDATLFKPADLIDGAYGQVLRGAQARGVQLLAYSLAFAKTGLAEAAKCDLELSLQKTVEIDLSLV